MDGRPKRIKKFAFTSVCVYNRLRVDGALESRSQQTPNVYLYHATKFSVYLSFTTGLLFIILTQSDKMSSSMSRSSIRNNLDTFCLVIPNLRN